MKNVLFLLSGLFLLSSCQDQLKTDIDLIEEFLAENGIDAEMDESGLFYTIDTEGNGEFPTVNDEVTVNYRGTLLEDGQEFDAGNNVTFPLGGVIRGWQIGIPKLSKGGSGRLYIPSELAYGTRALNGIPANSVLIFDVDLLDF